MIRLNELTIYPVKSMAGIAVDSIPVDAFGLQNDRRWLLVDKAGRFLSQRDIPRMALVKTSLSPEGLRFEMAGDKHNVELPLAANERQVEVWGDTVSALDAGDVTAVWLSGKLETDCRLVYMPDHCRRLVDPLYAQNKETVGFADGFPLLLISQSSLDDLNRRLSKPVLMNRFRPNLVVTGCEPFAEDHWRRILIGDLELQLVKPCARCVMPSIDQHSAQKDSEILRVLASYRRGKDRKTYFGQNLLYQKLGQLTVGQTVEILE